jgi:hypothetical protein
MFYKIPDSPPAMHEELDADIASYLSGAIDAAKFIMRRIPVVIGSYRMRFRDIVKDHH